MIKSSQLTSDVRCFPMLTSLSHFHTHPGPYRKDPESKAEKAVNLLKDSLKAKEETKQSVTTESTVDETSSKTLASPSETQVDTPRLSLWGRIVKEVMHYYNGFKLLFLETKIAYRLMKQVLHGHSLTRRERRQVCAKIKL